MIFFFFGKRNKKKTNDFFLQIYKIHNEVQNIKTKNGYTLTEKCVKLPILEVNQYSLRRKRETIDDEDWVKR